MHDIVHDFAQLISKSGYNLSTLFQHFRCLRVLTLFCGYHSMLTELPDAVGNFIHLRYLYLVHYCGVALPETICNLFNLQILHIEIAGGLQKLPQGMDKLINLRHFKLDYETLGCPNINFPRGFGRLTSLRTLKYFSVNGEDDSERWTLEIDGLGNEVDQCEATNAQLKKKRNLRTLKLLFDPDKTDPKEITRGMDALVLNALEPPPNLEDLSILYYKGPIMSLWMVSLTNLKKLFFDCLFIEHLPPLGKLPVLESLKIWEIYRLKRLGVEFMGIEESEKKEKDDISITLFPNLISLEFYGLIEWEEWNGIGGEEEEEDCTRRFAIMPRLQRLSIRYCPRLKSLPNFLHTIPLQNLKMEWCPILKERCKRGTGEEWPKISHIPNIDFDPFGTVTSFDASSSSPWSSSFILQYINIKLIKMLPFCQISY
ncbi:putative disease resistance protein rga4 [Quercus suber]|uniref:Disease resistance protein rga4 n=1 Tax=Quercus suber TaxID=58331 RepID=A0AAW0L9X3_QUESU